MLTANNISEIQNDPRHYQQSSHLARPRGALAAGFRNGITTVTCSSSGEFPCRIYLGLFWI